MMSESLINLKSAEDSIEMEVFKDNHDRNNDNRMSKRFVVSLANEQLSDEETVIKQWIHEYTANVDKINEFYLSQLSIIINRIDELKSEIKKTQVNLSSIIGS